METTVTEGKSVNQQEETRHPVDVETLVKGINERAFDTVERGSMEIGEYVLDELFHGRLDEATSRNPLKNQTLQEVCEHPMLHVNRRTLGGWVRAADFKRSLKACEVDCSRLKTSHFVALLQVADEETRRSLVVKANEGEWSVRHLAEEVQGKKQVKDSGGKAKELIKMVENPLDFGDDEAKRMLLDTKVLTEELDSSGRLNMVKTIDSTVARIMQQLELLKETKKSLVRIELGEPSSETA
jgi:hypothetical protein